MYEHLRSTYPDRSLLLSERRPYDIMGFAAEGHCHAESHPETPSDFMVSYDPRAGTMDADGEDTWLCVNWNGHGLEVITLGVMSEYHHKESRQMFLGPSKEVVEEFFRAVVTWDAGSEDQVRVFEGGYFSKSHELFEAIQNSTFDNLILANDLAEQIQQDLRGFFESRHLFEQYRIPWKRGILLLGPPGNGKTHAVKALINWLKVPCIYVRSLVSHCGSSQDCLRTLFERARELAPCVMIMEDLDALVSGNTRSYFLNELDGFAANQGIVVIASTNHPDLLDPAILDRPSRFDRKYTFELPQYRERRSYLQLMTAEFAEEMALKEGELDQVAAATEGYSFAYLKELVLSSMMAWISRPHVGLSMIDVMLAQVQTLLGQMVTEMNAPGRPTSSGPESFPFDREED